MSTEPQALDRSVLERKERDELQAIAEAMGAKTTSRAKKSDLVDTILREAGIEASPATGNGEVGGGGPPRRSRSGGAVPAAADGQEAPSSGGGTGDVVRTEAGAADAGLATDAAASAPGVTPAPAAPAPAAPAGDGGGGSRGPSGPRGPRTDDRPFRERGPRPGFDGGGSGGGGGGAEPGNRRNRRRRGRDRERGGGGGGGGGERELQAGSDAPFQGEPVPVEGLLDLSDQGYGFLRTQGYLPSARDIYVSLSQVRRFALRKGDYLTGANRPANSNEKYPALLRIDKVNDMTPDEARNRPRFEDLTPLFPDEKLRLEVPGDQANMVARIVDLISPIGKGQRGLIVSPPKAGKTTVLKQIAHSIEENDPEVHLIVLLVDERPEEVTDMRRSVKGEVVASTFDRPSDEHTSVAELTSERAKRLVEMGRDVVIVLDGITRLARAYNLSAPASGRILSGGVDSAALYPPKKFFGSARNIEEGGSLTILATALVETGSRMDEVIFEEFKGTGNMELRLDRRLAERRIYPAIDVDASSTRHEELLFDRNQLKQVWKLRRVLSGLSEGGAGLELLMDKIKTTTSNDEFLAEIAKAPAPAG